nr:MAG TPA: hypothetical protein [Caudoviricetes sp.]
MSYRDMALMYKTCLTNRLLKQALLIILTLEMKCLIMLKPMQERVLIN